jgi:P4 family phage/plasmid primase-like protien
MSSLGEFLKNHKAEKGGSYTHTRIGDKKSNIYAGSYNIPHTKTKLFQKLYVNHTFKQNKPEYLTEAQDRENGGPILIDFDFRYSTEITERQHSDEHVYDIVDLYVDKLRLLCNIDKKMFNVYIFEKPDIVPKDDLVKDGIHMIMGVHLSHDKQMLLRKHVLECIGSQVLDDLELQNTADNVLDEAITCGRNNWMMYGSRKPNNESYKLTYYYKVSTDKDDSTLEEQDVNNIKPVKAVRIFSPRYLDWPKAHLKPEYEEELKSMKSSSGGSRKGRIQQLGATMIDVPASLTNYTSRENLEAIVVDRNSLNQVMEITHAFLDKNHPDIKEIHDYTMALPERYYTEYSYWVNVAMALKATNQLLLTTFIYFSSQWERFDFGNISEILDKWDSIGFTSGKKLTHLSIRYWCQLDNKAEYDRIRSNSTDVYIKRTLMGGPQNAGADYDMAVLAKHLYKDQFRCVSIKKNIWFTYQGNKWHECDSGSDLRKNLSSHLAKIYISKERECMMKIRDLGKDITEGQQKQLSTEAATYCNVAWKLKGCTPKNNIMTECKHMFYDNQLLSKLDTNEMLLCFNNGVYDFDMGEFRKGLPEDYISLSTKINYVKVDRENPKHKKATEEIEDFMAKLFPDPKLRDYMWEHAASSLTGNNLNQTFNIYTGIGSNGKSMFVKLMEKSLGDLKGTVPISLITKKRQDIGSSSSEVACLKGLRYACMNEPSKGDKINEGILKEITGGDPIQARQLYSESITFIPQFKLVCCTNHLFEIKAQDDGTWRRIRQVPFESRFVGNPSNNPQDKEFKKDKTLEKKLTSWAPIFMGMLIEIARKNKGHVRDCSKVMEASNNYRQRSDFLTKYVKECIKRTNDPNDTLSKKEVKLSFKEWYESSFDDKLPPLQDLYDKLDTLCGKYKLRKWVGVKIIYDYDYPDEMET